MGASKYSLCGKDRTTILLQVFFSSRDSDKATTFLIEVFSHVLLLIFSALLRAWAVSFPKERTWKKCFTFPVSNSIKCLKQTTGTLKSEAGASKECNRAAHRRNQIWTGGQASEREKASWCLWRNTSVWSCRVPGLIRPKHWNSGRKSCNTSVLRE